MISVRGYFYDVTLSQFISDTPIDCTIACMRNYSYNPIDNLNPYNMAWAANYINSANAGQINASFTYDTGFLIVAGALSPDTFEWDEMNLLLWIYSYFDTLKARYNSNHIIRFVRDHENIDDNYIEYNVDISASDLFLKYNNSIVRLYDCAHRIYNTDKPILYTYANNVPDVEPTKTEIYYVGSFISNDIHPLGYFNNIYKANDVRLITDAPILEDVRPFVHYSSTAKRPPYPTAGACNAYFTYRNYNFPVYIAIEHGTFLNQFQNQPQDSLHIWLFSAAQIEATNFYEEYRPAYVPDSRDTNFQVYSSGEITYLHMVEGWNYYFFNNFAIDTTYPIIELGTVLPNDYPITRLKEIIDTEYNTRWEVNANRPEFYGFLIYNPAQDYEEPDPTVDPEYVPPEDLIPYPTYPDTQDPYYDPSSDPKSPAYDPEKDPKNPAYDPTTPHPAYRPPSTSTYPRPAPMQNPPSPVEPPETPPSYVTTNALFTLYNPSGGDMTSIANYLWSPAWSIDTFKKILANPMDCILGIMVMPQLPAIVDTKELSIGNMPTGINLHFFTVQFFDFDCGNILIPEYYNSYLDYSPYTKISIFLPYIGDKMLNTDEVMNHRIGVKYRFDLATGDCIAFITIDGYVMYSFSGNCAARLPLSSSNFNGLIPSIFSAIGAAGTMGAIPAIGAAGALTVSAMKQDISHSGNLSGSAGLMGVQIPYIIINRPRQVAPINQNAFTGYPSFINEKLGDLHGYTEIESCHLEHVPATAEELAEIEQLLKAGVLF